MHHLKLKNFAKEEGQIWVKFDPRSCLMFPYSANMYIVSVSMLKSSCQIFRFDESKLGISASRVVLLTAKHFCTKQSKILGKNAVDHNNNAAIKDHQ